MKRKQFSSFGVRATLALVGAAISAAASGHHEAFLASEVIGADVFAEDGRFTGEVHDLQISQEGMITVVVSLGGVPGIGDKLVQVARGDFHYSHDARGWSVSMTRTELYNQPDFERGEDTSFGGEPVRR